MELSSILKVRYLIRLDIFISLNKLQSIVSCSLRRERACLQNKELKIHLRRQ